MDETEKFQRNNSPQTSTAGLRFEDLFDLQEIQHIQDAFAEATGVSALMTDVKGLPITQPSHFSRLCSLIRGCPKGRARCMHSDTEIGTYNPSGPVVGNCLSGGLMDGGTSISVGERMIAKWLIGQVVEHDFDEERFCLFAREIGLDETEALQALAEVPRMSLAHFGKICGALHLIGTQLSKLALKT